MRKKPAAATKKKTGVLNLQAIYDRVARHLLRQNRAAMLDGSSDCAYRGAGGTRCAIGCLIKDEFYSPEMENKTIMSDQPIVRRALGKSLGVTTGTITKNATFFEDLRGIHDRSDPEFWFRMLGDLARNKGLKPVTRRLARKSR
jgi:hypothetical protein